MEENLTERYRATPLAHFCMIDQQAVILDLESEEFLGLNTMSAVLWTLLVHEAKTPREVVQTITERYDADPQRVTEDLETFIATMKQRHLLQGESQDLHAQAFSSRSARFKTHEFLLAFCSWLTRTILKGKAVAEWTEAYLCLQCVDGWLHLQGLEALAARLQHIPASHLVERTNEDVQRLAGTMASTARWQRFHAVCLHQYLALCWLLRCRGMRVACVIGAELYPFFAHAWVTCGEDAVQHALHWQNGLGLDKSIEVLQRLSLLFSTDAAKRPEDREGE